MAIGQVNVRVTPLTCWTLGTTPGLQFVEALRTDPRHDVVGAGHVLGGQHTGQAGELLGDDFGAAHFGLDQHESLDHPAVLPLAA